MVALKGDIFAYGQYLWLIVDTEVERGGDKQGERGRATQAASAGR